MAGMVAQGPTRAKLAARGGEFARGHAGRLAARTSPALGAVDRQTRRLDVECKARGQQLAGKFCRLTGKTANNGYSVSHSHIRTKRLQHVNLHVTRVYWEREKRWVKLRLSTKAIKTISKIGLEATAKRAGIDLYQAPFTIEQSEERKKWKAENPSRVVPKDKRAMVNLEKLASSDHPLAAEAKALYDKVKPQLTGDARQDKALLNLRKLSLSDNELAGEAARVLSRNEQVGQRLGAEYREKKYEKMYGFAS